MPAPESSHGQQVGFFVSLQHLLAEGEFVSTYKFALLLSLVRWSVEHGDHPEGQSIDVGELAPYFAELYWPQVRPFTSGAGAPGVREAPPPYGGSPADWSGMLLQDRGRQMPRVLRLIRSAQEAGAGSLTGMEASAQQRLLRQVRNTIREMPLWKLQRVGRSETLEFLYREGGGAGEILFQPGIVQCLARFAPLVEDLVRAAWLRFVLRCNQALLGVPGSQLEGFLFPNGRQALGSWVAPLQELQDGQCFYCAKRVQEPQVDHFLPWSRYPRDLGHNFVLAHGHCNGQKSHHLASAGHLEKWCARNADHGELLAAAFREKGLPHDMPAVHQVAQTLYSVTAEVGAPVWHEGRNLIPLDPAWRAILGAA